VRLHSNPSMSSLGFTGFGATPCLAAAHPTRLPQRVTARLGSEMIERIAAEYQSDTSSVRLTGRYGIGKGTILRLLRQNGLAIRRRGQSR
jgi:hypothetical protein